MKVFTLVFKLILTLAIFSQLSSCGGGNNPPPIVNKADLYKITLVFGATGGQGTVKINPSTIHLVLGLVIVQMQTQLIRLLLWKCQQ